MLQKMFVCQKKAARYISSHFSDCRWVLHAKKIAAASPYKNRENKKCVKTFLRHTVRAL